MSIRDNNINFANLTDRLNAAENLHRAGQTDEGNGVLLSLGKDICKELDQVKRGKKG